MQAVIVVHDKISQMCEGFFGKFSRDLQRDEFILRALDNNSGNIY